MGAVSLRIDLVTALAEEDAVVVHPVAQGNQLLLRALHKECTFHLLFLRVVVVVILAHCLFAFVLGLILGQNLGVHVGRTREVKCIEVGLASFFRLQLLEVAHMLLARTAQIMNGCLCCYPLVQQCLGTYFFEGNLI